MHGNKPLLVICGPTATGKTDYALELAKSKNGELVSADSRQIYQYLDIGTGKDLPEHAVFTSQNERLGIDTTSGNLGYYIVDSVPLWLYDVIPPNQLFSAADYASLARVVIDDIWSRDKLPIVVGGSGMYIKMLVDGAETAGIPPNLPLREKLAFSAVDDLRQILKSFSLNAYRSLNSSDRQNPRRLMRRIEIEAYKKLQPQSTGLVGIDAINADITFIGLILPIKELYRRIDKRVDRRIQQGIVDEIGSLLKKGYVWDDPGLTTIGYKEWKTFFLGKEKAEDVVQQWKYHEHGYARRQRVWFRKDKRIRWIASPS